MKKGINWNRIQKHWQIQIQRIGQQYLHLNLSDEYAVRIELVCAVLGATVVLAVLAGTISRQQAFIHNVARPNYGQISENKAFTIQDSRQGEEYELNLVVEPRKFTRQQAEENFEKAYDWLLQNMIGENPSLEAVSTKLNLVTALPEYGMQVDWFSSNYRRIEYDGTVYTEYVSESGEMVALTAVLKYEEYEAEYVIDVTVVQPELSEEERRRRVVEEELQSVLQKNRQEAELTLPEQIDGAEVSYLEPNENPVGAILLLGVLLAAALVLKRINDAKKADRTRKMQLQYDYSEVVSKLTLLTGAGMSIQRAWEKMVTDYQGKRQSGEPQHFAYEEMLVTYHKIHSGMSEGAAYTDFGRRCGIREYLKLGTLLEQNVRKGTKGLTMLLEQEAADSFEQRKNYARQMGEEAGTKLLLPMGMMLVVVMVIVIVPAFLSFQI